MKSPALSFTGINIREMPGFETGGFAIENLASGMNIIYGPNASGKSSLSRAMGMLLRSADEHGDDCSLVGKLTVDGETLLIDYRPGKVATQREGMEIQAQNLAPDAMEDRYILALTDLLSDDDEADELTKKILREASGGYDLADAGESARFRHTPRNKGSSQRTYEDAANELKKAQLEAKQLADEEQELPRLAGELQKAEAAEKDLELLQRTGKYRDLFAKEASAREARDEFPSGMEKLQVDAPERLSNIANEIETREAEKTSAEAAHLQAQAAIEHSPLHPTDGIKSEIVTALQEKVKNLEELERKKNDAATKVKEASASIDSALVSLGGGDGEAEAVKDLDLEKTGKLLEFARRAEIFQRDLIAYDKVRNWLKTEGGTEDVNSLRDGRKALNNWLVRINLPGPAPHAEQAHPAPLKSPAFLLSLAIALVFLVAGIIDDVKWILGLPLPLFQAGWLLWRSRQKPVLADDRHDPERSKARYKKTGLDNPADWTPDAVETLLQRLDALYDQARLEEERRQRWADEKNRGTELKERKDSLELERAQWREELGLDWDHNDLDLYLRVVQLKTLLEAQQALAVAKAARGDAAANFDDLLEEIAGTIQQYGLAPPGDCALAHSMALKLDTLRSEYTQAQADSENAQRDIKNANELIELRETDREQVFRLAGLKADQEAELRSRLEKLEDYKAKKASHESALTLLQAAKNALSGNPDLLELTDEEISDRRNKLEFVAAKKEELTDQRIRLLAGIEQAEARTDIAEKLADRDRAADILRVGRKEDQAAIIGDALVRFVRQKHHQVGQTGIFSRARSLFSKFTRGYFKLEIDDNIDKPGFRCVDTASDRGRSLEQLSSNTRIQLFLSVRIAFVENQEQGGRKMPFILDEALAVSDELWAEEIIKAGIDICSDGRQFFYLTAQHDEVGKWRRLLEDTDLEARVIDLAEVREFSQKDRVPPQVFEPPPAVEIPSPAGMDHDTYGRALDVPSIDQGAAVGAVHLWYLIEDPEKLCELLNNGINLWGQLENLVESNNSENLTTDSPVYRNAVAAARALESALRYRLVGRGRPVDRRPLKESNSCGTFLEAVVEKAEELDGDGESLVKALTAGEIKGFRKQKISNLEEYLEEHGFIAVQEALSPAEIAERVKVEVYKDLETGLLSAERLSWLIQQVLRNNK